MIEQSSPKDTCQTVLDAFIGQYGYQVKEIKTGFASLLGRDERGEWQVISTEPLDNIARLYEFVLEHIVAKAYHEGKNQRTWEIENGSDRDWETMRQNLF